MTEAVFTWVCDKHDHYALKTIVLDSNTPDCPVCHHTMEAHDNMDAHYISEVFLPFAQMTMMEAKRILYWYNATQTVIFHPDKGILIENHEDSLV